MGARPRGLLALALRLRRRPHGRQVCASQSRGIVCKPKVNRTDQKGPEGPVRRAPGFRGAVHRWDGWVALRKKQQTAMDADLAAVRAAAEAQRQREEAAWARKAEAEQKAEDARLAAERARLAAEKVVPANPSQPDFDPMQAARDWVEANVRAQSQRLFPRPKPLGSESFKRVPMREGAATSGWFGRGAPACSGPPRRASPWSSTAGA